MEFVGCLISRQLKFIVSFLNGLKAVKLPVIIQRQIQSTLSADSITGCFTKLDIGLHVNLNFNLFTTGWMGKKMSSQGNIYLRVVSQKESESLWRHK